MNIEIKNVNKIFNKVYMQFIKSTCRYNVLYGGAGSGKSVAITQILLIKLLRNKNRKLLVVRKVSRTLKDSVFAEFKSTISKFKLTQYCKFNNTDYTITLPNNSIIIFKGIDDPEKIKSIAGITDIWIEEASELTQEDFQQLDLRLRGLAGNQQIFISFNPISDRHWLKREFFDKQNNNTLVLKTTYKDNKFLNKDYIDTLEQLKQRDENYYNIYALGNWGCTGDLIFTHYKVVAGKDIPVIDNSNITIGLDFGFNPDPTSLVKVAYMNNKIYVLDEWGANNLTTTELVGVLKNKPDLICRHPIFADSAEPKSIQELRSNGFNIRAVKKGPDSIRFGINFIKGHELIVSDNCTQIKKELQSYSWKKDKNGDALGVPVDFDNHYIDALRYALSVSIDSKRNIRGNIKLPAGF